MPKSSRPIRNWLAAIMATSICACTGSFTGPVEVTRFVSERPVSLGAGTITISFPDEMRNETARNAFAAAVADELSRVGYIVILDGSATARNTAVIRTTRNSLAPASSRGPVNVGVGGSTGSYGSGVGVGIGLNLGSSRSRPNILTELSVRISGPDGMSQWEGRAQHPVSLKSPYADVDASARALAAALFKDFPSGNGETISIDVDELQEPQ